MSLGSSSSAEYQGMESTGRRCSKRSLCGPWGLQGQTRKTHGSCRNNPIFAAFLLFQALKVFIKIVTVHRAEQDNK